MVLESGVTYEWFAIAIHVSHAGCPIAHRVLRSYFSGAARPAGPVPRDGAFVLGWLCHTGPAVPHGGTSARCVRHRAVITARWTASASAQTQVSVNAGGAILAVKPTRIHLVSNENLAQLQWSSWGGQIANAAGTDYANSPSSGHSATNPVQVELSGRKRCGSRLVYTNVRVQFISDVPYDGYGPLVTFPFGCPAS